MFDLDSKHRLFVNYADWKQEDREEYEEYCNMLTLVPISDLCADETRLTLLVWLSAGYMNARLS